MPRDNDKRTYEAMFLVDTGDAAVWDGLTKDLTNILTRHGGEIIGITRWDERKLAYPIAKHKRGTYVLMFFSLTDGNAVTEIERDCQLSEKVLRVLVLRADHYKIADMRMQLGEDIREDVAQQIAAERGESRAAEDAGVEGAEAADTPPEETKAPTD